MKAAGPSQLAKGRVSTGFRLENGQYAFTFPASLLADDHSSFRICFSYSFWTSSNWEVCGEVRNGFGSGSEATELPIPTFVLMDLNMPNLNGIEATRKDSLALPFDTDSYP